MKAALAALELATPAQNWLEEIPHLLTKHGFAHVRKGPHIRCWQPEEAQLHKRKVPFVNGFDIGRLWVGRGKAAVGLTPRRIYLTDENQPDSRSEVDILGGLDKPVTDIGKALKRQAHLLGLLGGAQCTSSQVALNDADTGHARSVSIHSCHASIPVNSNLRMFLRNNGMHNVPDGFRLAVLPADPACEQAAQSYFHKVQNWFGERRHPIAGGVYSLDAVVNRVAELESGASPNSKMTAIVFINPGADDSTSKPVLSLMQRLDKLRIPWRRARATDDQTWSVEDQLGSLVTATGGYPYFVTADDNQLPWCIGIDISHPRDAEFSTACAALTDPGGNLVQAWTIRHLRNEKMPEESIRQLVNAAEKKLVELDSDPDILLIRDGRIFERENPHDYTDSSIGRITLLELLKGGNPTMLTGEEMTLPDHPVIATVPGGGKNERVAFMTPYPDVNFGFPRVLKLRHRDKWNGAGLSEDKLYKTLCALCFAPGLGLSRHTLPAPIYWADGIAKASDSDLRYRGQKVTRLD